MMDKDLLVAIAEAVLTKLIGAGAWRTKIQREKFEPIEDPIVGLAVGDSVWNYDEDEERLQERKVVSVENGIAYVYWNSSYYGPSLISVSRQYWGKTKKEAVELWRDTILSDIDYINRRAGTTEYLKSLLNERPT